MTIKLDIKDKKILQQLDKNSRQSFAKIGKKVGLSKNVVQYRVKELERKNVIQSYYTIINVAKLGFTYTRVYFNFHSLTKENYKQMVDDFKAMPNLNWLGAGEGEWEFAAVFLTKNINEMSEIYRQIIDKYSKYIVDKDISPAIRLHIFDQNYAYFGKESSFVVVSGNSEIEKLDEKDLKIIEALQQSPKIKILELSQKVHLTPKIVSSRIKRLILEKFILGFRYQLNHKILGYDYCHIYFVLQNLTKQKRLHFIEYLKSIKNIFYITEGLGKYDIECEFMVQSQNELHSIISNIEDKFPDLIRTYKSALIYEVYKAF